MCHGACLLASSGDSSASPRQQQALLGLRRREEEEDGWKDRPGSARPTRQASSPSRLQGEARR